uniref:Uncharacterized protein n=1 Tax=Molossus molossus TaxID=27622 RepID=A0A7J8I0X3_MOLMO|nr:hypothetical protein HJG59_010821 [Molossus molossus]
MANRRDSLPVEGAPGHAAVLCKCKHRQGGASPCCRWSSWRWRAGLERWIKTALCLPNWTTSPLEQAPGPLFCPPPDVIIHDCVGGWMNGMNGWGCPHLGPPSLDSFVGHLGCHHCCHCCDKGGAGPEGGRESLLALGLWGGP